MAEASSLKESGGGVTRTAEGRARYMFPGAHVRAYAITDPEVLSLDRRLNETYPNIPADIKYATFRDIVDESDAYNILRITEDNRSGRPNDDMDRVDTVSMNIGITNPLISHRREFTRDLVFHRTLSAAARYNSRRR